MQRREIKGGKSTSRKAVKVQQQKDSLNLTLSYANRGSWHKYRVSPPLAKELLQELCEIVRKLNPDAFLGQSDRFYLSSRLTGDRCRRCERTRVFAPSCAADEQCFGHLLNDLDWRKIRIVAKEAREKAGIRTKRFYRVLFAYGYEETPFIYDVAAAELYYHATFPCTCFDCPNTVYKGYRTESKDGEKKKEPYTRCLLRDATLSAELLRELQIFCDSLQRPERKEERGEE